jgi:hypothetical protein
MNIMNTIETQTDESGQAPTSVPRVRVPYRTPALTVHGTIADLTRGAGTGNGDGTGSNNG